MEVIFWGVFMVRICEISEQKTFNYDLITQSHTILKLWKTYKWSSSRMNWSFTWQISDYNNWLTIILLKTHHPLCWNVFMDRFCCQEHIVFKSTDGRITDRIKQLREGGR